MIDSIILPNTEHTDKYAHLSAILTFTLDTNKKESLFMSNTSGIDTECLDTTGFSYTLSLINGKYKMTILYTLMRFGVVRFNEMKKYIGTISYKTLSTTLKELEADQLIHREEYPQIPPKVEYSLTDRGRSLIPILDGMCEWGEENRLPK